MFVHIVRVTDEVVSMEQDRKMRLVGMIQKYTGTQDTHRLLVQGTRSDCISEFVEFLGLHQLNVPCHQ